MTALPLRALGPAVEFGGLLLGRADHPRMAAANAVLVDGVKSAELLVIGDWLGTAPSQKQGENNKGVFHGSSAGVNRGTIRQAEQFGGGVYI
jgi:hypothetical protein